MKNESLSEFHGQCNSFYPGILTLVIFFVHISDSTNIMVSVGITVSLQISFLTAVWLSKIGEIKQSPEPQIMVVSGICFITACTAQKYAVNTLPLLHVQYKLLDNLFYAVFVVARRNIVGQLFQRRDGVAHRYTKTSDFQHLVIVPRVTDGDALAEFVTEMVGKERQGVTFRAFFMHNFEEIRLGFGDVYFRPEQLTQLYCYLIQIVWLVDDEQFWRRLFNDFDEVRLDVILRTV